MPEKETIYTVKYFLPSSRLGINQERFSNVHEANKFKAVLDSHGFESKVTSNIASVELTTRDFYSYKFITVKVTAAGPVCEWHKINKPKF